MHFTGDRVSATPYSTVLATLSKNPSIFKPSKPKADDATAAIADLHLHPAIEAALHILNDDLQSAHFLVRKMQVEPAFEGMILHAILHRIEGDYEKSRSWYSKTASSEIFARVWSDKGSYVGAMQLIDDIEIFSKGTKAGTINNQSLLVAERTKHLERACEEEMQAILKWCENKFGTEEWEDARDEFDETNERLDLQKIVDDLRSQVEFEK